VGILLYAEYGINILTHVWTILEVIMGDQKPGRTLIRFTSTFDALQQVMALLDDKSVVSLDDKGYSEEEEYGQH
jgi:hypothetical protein